MSRWRWTAGRTWGSWSSSSKASRLRVRLARPCVRSGRVGSQEGHQCARFEPDHISRYIYRMLSHVKHIHMLLRKMSLTSAVAFARKLCVIDSQLGDDTMQGGRDFVSRGSLNSCFQAANEHLDNVYSSPDYHTRIHYVTVYTSVRTGTGCLRHSISE